MNHIKRMTAVFLLACLMLSAPALALTDETPAGYITMSFEKFTLGLGYVLWPARVPFYAGENLAQVTIRYLGDGNSKYSGTPAKGFYLIAVHDEDASVPVIPQYILNKTQTDTYHPLTTTKQDPAFLSQYDFYYMGGWIWEFNNDFENYSVAACFPKDGDVVRWQFSVSGYGKDLGGGYRTNADGSRDYSRCWLQTADKDALTAAVAEINSAADKETRLADTAVKSAYDAAIAVLSNMEADQITVDAALGALSPVQTQEPDSEPKYTVRYDANGATGDVPVDVNEYPEGATATAKSPLDLTAPAGKTFYEWNTLASGSGISYAEFAPIPVSTQDIELYAIWATPSYSSDSDTPETVTYDIPAVIKTTTAYLTNAITSPGIASVGGEWSVIGLSRSGTALPDGWLNAYIKNAETYIIQSKGTLSDTKSTDYSRVILAFTAIGKDPSDIGGYNLFDALSDVAQIRQQGIGGPIWALIALDSHSYAQENDIRQQLLDAILQQEISGGGFALGNEITPDIDVTAMAVTALSKYKSDAAIKPYIDRALTVLSDRQQANGGYQNGSGELNPESCAQVLTALCTLGIDPDTDMRFIKNENTVLSAIMQFSVKDGGFAHNAGGEADMMSTEQALYALTAYQRQKNGKTALFDMTDVTLEQAQKVQTTEQNEPEITNEFTDLENHWAKKEIDSLVQKKIFNGKSDTIFEPDQSITRAEFAAALARAMSLEPVPTDKFTDVGESDWFAVSVGAAVKSGLILGVSNTEFAPYADITREEAAVMLARARTQMKRGADTRQNEVVDLLAGFTDYMDSSDWSRLPLASCVKNGIISQDNIEIRPLGKITRAEAAVMIYRLLSIQSTLAPSGA